MSEFPRARRQNGVLLMAKLMLLCLGIGGLLGASLVLLDSFTALPGFILSAAILIVLMTAGMFAASWWWWRGLDEAAREAHKWAWFWGGSGGMAFCLAMMAAAGLRPEALNLALADVSADRIVMASAACLLVCQTIGYGLAWGAWWLRHR